MKNVTVQGAPAIYKAEPGILRDLPEMLENQAFSKAGIIHGEQSWKAAQPYFPKLTMPVQLEAYAGECSHKEVMRLSEALRGCDVLISIGGGKVLDLGKACADQLDIPAVLIPTLASNCAPWTPLSVFYDDEGNFEEYIIYPRSTWMLLVEPDLLVRAPEPYLRAGIGDTLAKWYEADVLTRSLASKPISVDIALHAARLCRDVLIQDGREAVEAVRQQAVIPAFMRVAETIIMAGGMVGGYGDSYGRIAGAHSIHNGLTKVPETHHFLHGEKVAYGILVQLALEGRFDEIEALTPYYQEMDLPVTLDDFNLTNKAEAISITAEHALKPGESIRLMNVMDAAQVEEAMTKIENG
ncbi:iron-containing alcohol dehydrogenase family protein [Halobacillus kuroshimensis]|uniref:iron-containing alcohol dehydrogenase family protein n=1 Tax=Halobacillus kuroshimensis TaxID=302481 RepID=UPI000404EE13|nr:iron-containing alcohol dehydrogenase family protein [Halobacillus kuroshimensis]